MRRSERGLSLIETMVAITLFTLFTIGIVPLLGTSMRGSATTRTESVGRNVASKTLERLRGLQYHVAYSGTPSKADLLDHFFPGRTPAYGPPTTTTGFDAGSNSFVTTCDADSTAPACKSLPSSAEIPEGFSVEIRLTFKDPASPATTVPVPSTYAWNAGSDQDAPPSQLVEVGVTSAWTVGTKQRTFALRSYLSQRDRQVLPAGGSGGAPPPPPPGGGGAPSPPPNVKLRAEARIDYAVEGTTTYQDTQTPPRMTDVTMTMGTAQAYGEQLDSGSKADLSVRAGTVRAVRAADPAVSGDVGVDTTLTGAALDAHAPADATSNAITTTTTNQLLNTSEVNAPNGMAYVSPSEAGTLSGTRVGPTVSGGLPFVKGYYDFNGTTSYFPNSVPTHMWMNAQYATSSSSVPGTATTENPYNLRTTLSSNTYKMLSIRDLASGADPRGEVEIDSTATSPGTSRVVRSKATINPGANIMPLPTYNLTSGRSLFEITNFTASVTCEAKADASAPSVATGSWSADFFFHADTNNNGSTALGSYITTLPTQTNTGNALVPVGDTNPLQTIKNLNSGNGPLIYDNSNNTYDVYLFEGNGRKGLLKDWSTGGLTTSISSDDRVASAAYNGILRFETRPLRGPWDATTGSTTHPQSDMTTSIGKLSCKSEDYR